MRFLRSVYYQKKMAKGKIILTDNSISEWVKNDPINYNNAKSNIKNLLFKFLNKNN